MEKNVLGGNVLWAMAQGCSVAPLFETMVVKLSSDVPARLPRSLALVDTLGTLAGDSVN